MFKVSSVQLEIDFIAYPVTYRYLKNSQTKVRFSHTGKLYIKYLKTFTMEKMKYFAPYADVSPSMTFVKGCERDRQTVLIGALRNILCAKCHHGSLKYFTL